MLSPKQTHFLLSLGGLVISVLAAIFLSTTAGIIVAFALTIAYIFYDIRVEIRAGREQLEREIIKMRDEFAVKLGPLSRLIQIRDNNCPLFSQAAEEIYQEALNRIELLERRELRTTNLEEVYHWLEFLFCHFADLKVIKAVSSGEFDEWRATDSWWIEQYLRLHQVAHTREIKIERIFILKTKRLVKTYEDIFQMNAKHHVQVKLAAHSHISHADHQLGNCMLFYTDNKEPIYALVAYHNNHGSAEEVVIYSEPQKIKPIAEAYARISRVAESYSTKDLALTP